MNAAEVLERHFQVVDNRKDAKRLCSRLKRRGTSCFVAKISS